jgi:hypothetical protein
MNKKEMEERLSLEDVMKHEFFAGIDFNNLPTLEQAKSQMTPYECTYHKICQTLIEKYSTLHKEKIEVRENTYKNEILPYLH